MPKLEKFKCDILSNFQTFCTCCWTPCWSKIDFKPLQNAKVWKNSFKGSRVVLSSSWMFVRTPQKEGYFRGQLLTLSDIFWTVRDDPCALKSPPKKEKKKLRGEWLFHIQKKTRKRKWAASIICLDASNYLLPLWF